MVNTDAGIYLDSRFDFNINSTGDTKSTKGVEELHKDLAVQMAIVLSRYKGAAPSGNLEAKVAGTATETAEADSRINSVPQESLEVTFNDTYDEITVEMRARTELGTAPLIFEI